MNLLPAVLAVLLLNSGTFAAVTPPTLNKRIIAPFTNESHGIEVKFDDGGKHVVLFLANGWTTAVSSNTPACVHFHLAPWFAIQEHVRRGAKEPLLIFALGEGSSTYRVAFQDTNRFARMLALAESELRSRSGMGHARIGSIEVSSFSAGYAAVRELLKSPAYFQLIRRVALLDSMYAGLEPTKGNNTNRVPLASHIDVWVPLAKAAMRGEKTFVITHSQVPTTPYASSAECAQALLARLGLTFQAVSPGSSAAASDPDFPLLARAITNQLHVWSYAGSNAQAHMTHARHLADVWRALDAIPTPRVTE